jgi:transposase
MKCNRDTDGRKLDHKTLEKLRFRTVQQVLDGVSPEELAETLGLNRATIYRWVNKYHYGGWDALKAQPVPGRPPKLTAEQMAWVAKTVREKNPLQLNFPFALWTLGMIRELIRKQFQVRLSEVSVGRLMRNLGFSAQRPLRRASEQDPVMVERWRSQDYPQIRKQAKKAKALIFFADEASIRSDYHSGHTWAPKGRTPIVEKTGARFSLNMMSAISPKGEFRFMVHEGTATAETFCLFLKRLAAGIEQKIYLIVDGHRIHRAKKVQKLLKKLKGKITLFFLPPYSPQLNPDEWVWAQVKGKVGKQIVRSRDELKEKVNSALRSLQRMPEKLKKIFHAPDCRYAMEV